MDIEQIREADAKNLEDQIISHNDETQETYDRIVAQLTMSRGARHRAECCRIVTKSCACFVYSVHADALLQSSDPKAMIRMLLGG